MLRDQAVLWSVRLLGTPYIWGGNDPQTDKGLDCSGMVGYIFRQLGCLPEGYDDTAQGYYNRYKRNAVERPVRGCLAFYGKNPSRITHVMLIVSSRLCIGAIRGNRWMDTVAKARARGARIDWRPIKYRRDLIAIVDPFKEA